MTSEEYRRHVRNLADHHCRAKHRDYYDSLICVGPNQNGFGPPCDGCIHEVESELEQKRGKAHGRELSADEAEEVRKRLGIS